MDTEEQTTANIQESLVEQVKAGNMAPLETEDCESGYTDQKENRDPKQQEAVLMESDDGAWPEKDTHKIISTDGEMDNTEDGEILEDGEIASDQDGEVNDNFVTQENKDDEIRSESSKSTSTKSRNRGHSRDVHVKNGHSRKERHSKQRRTSKEESHKDKQKKKGRHREPADYRQKEGDEGQWLADRCDKGDRSRDRLPARSYKRPRHGGEERSRRNRDSEKRHNGKGDTHHRGSKDRDGERNKDRLPHNDCIEKDRKDRERHEKDKKTFDDHESPPGIYDSPSDDEYSDSRFEDKKPLNTVGPTSEGFENPWNTAGPSEEGFEKPVNTAGPTGEGFREEKSWNIAGQADELVSEDADMEAVGKNKRQSNKRKNNFERRHNRAIETISDDFEDEQPLKKKPLLQTPMEERPICKFYKEGKCQKGSECLFNHDCQLQKRFELCKYHLQSQCRKREECVFMHEDFPCKYFHTGSTCYQGDSCKFSHDPLTPDTETALQLSLSEREDFVEDHNFEVKKNRRKGLLGDQPALSVEEVQRKLEHIKYIPSIFDIQTHAPIDSQSKPPTSQSINVRPQGFYPDNNMSPQAGMTGPHLRFNVPPTNQGTPPNRPPFIIGPGIDGPPMGPPPMINVPGLMGSGPPPMMTVPGMQGPPMGPPMSQQTAALVGAILRAAPMLQQYTRGPIPQGPMTSLASTMGGDTRFLGSNLMVPIPNIVQSSPISIMSPAAVMQDGIQQSVMSHQQNIGQAQQEMVPSQLQTNLSLAQINTGGSLRDPRKMAPALNDPRLTRISQDTDMRDLGDMDMRSASTSGKSQKENLGEDLRQDVDFRHDDSNKGDRTPQQDWDDIEHINEWDDDMDIPDHLPLKQHEMFLHIQQHSLKLKKKKSAQQSHMNLHKSTEAQSQDDDRWYSSDDDDDDGKPSISNILPSLNQTQMRQEPVTMMTGTTTTPSAISVMQMINKIKHSTPTSASSASPSRAMDPRKQMKPKEQAIIMSHDGDCSWRLCKVLCVKQRIPDNINPQDTKYKNDPRVQKMLKLHDLEIDKVIDHTKASVRMKKEPLAIEPKLPDLLDPNIFNEKKSNLAKSELMLFIDPNPVKLEFSGKPAQKSSDLRFRSGSETISNQTSDLRVHRSSSNQGLGQSQPVDPRMVHQDSSLGSSENLTSRPTDRRFLRQDSQEQFMGGGNSTPPLDTTILSKQTSNDPSHTKCDTLDIDVSLSKSASVRLFNNTECESDQLSLPRQLSQSNISAETSPTSVVHKPKLDYRNDPRFKRKPISESNRSPETLGKRFSGQQQSSVEYSSPLGVESSKVEESGYNSYNSPHVTKHQQTQSQNFSVPPTTKSVSVPSSDLIPLDILDSLPITLPLAISESQGPNTNLKDIFKTIDPTASPFC